MTGLYPAAPARAHRCELIGDRIGRWSAGRMTIRAGGAALWAFVS